MKMFRERERLLSHSNSKCSDSDSSGGGGGGGNNSSKNATSFLIDDILFQRPKNLGRDIITPLASRFGGGMGHSHSSGPQMGDGPPMHFSPPPGSNGGGGQSMASYSAFLHPFFPRPDVTTHPFFLAAAGLPFSSLFTGGDPNAKHCRRRKARTVFSDQQLNGLEKRFEAQRYLSTPERIELANALNLSETQHKKQLRKGTESGGIKSGSKNTSGSVSSSGSISESEGIIKRADDLPMDFSQRGVVSSGGMGPTGLHRGLPVAECTQVDDLCLPNKSKMNGDKMLFPSSNRSYNSYEDDENTDMEENEDEIDIITEDGPHHHNTHHHQNNNHNSYNNTNNVTIANNIIPSHHQHHPVGLI